MAISLYRVLLPAVNKVSPCIVDVILVPAPDSVFLHFEEGLKACQGGLQDTSNEALCPDYANRFATQHTEAFQNWAKSKY